MTTFRCAVCRRRCVGSLVPVFEDETGDAAECCSEACARAALDGSPGLGLSLGAGRHMLLAHEELRDLHDQITAIVGVASPLASVTAGIASVGAFFAGVAGGLARGAIEAASNDRLLALQDRAWALEEGLRAATLHLAAAQSAGPAIREATRLLLECDVGPVVAVAVADTDTMLGIERHLRGIRDRVRSARDLVVARRLEDHPPRSG